MMLSSYDFPGNVRELKSLIFDAVSRLCTPQNNEIETLTPDMFEMVIGREPKERHQETVHQASISFPKKLPTIKHVTELLVQEAMKRATGRQSYAAQMLGISQQALSKRLIKYRVDC